MAQQFPNSPVPIGGGLFGAVIESQQTDIAQERNALYQQQLQQQIQENQQALLGTAIETAGERIDKLLAERRIRMNQAAGGAESPATVQRLEQEIQALQAFYNEAGSLIGTPPLNIDFQATPINVEAAQAGEEAAAKREPIPEAAERAGAVAGAEATAREAAKPATTGETVSGRDAAGNIVTFNVQRDRQGNILGLQKITGGPQRSLEQVQQLSGGQEQELRVETGALDNTIAAVKRVRALPDAEKGFTGTLKRTVKGAAEVAGDVVTVFGDELGPALQGAAEAIREDATLDLGNIDDPEFASQIAFGDLATVEVVEALLAYSVARTLRPDGRLDRETINTAKKQAKLTGLTSAEAVNQRLDELLNVLEGQKRVLEQSRPEATQTGPTAPEGTPRLRLNPETGELEPF